MLTGNHSNSSCRLITAICGIDGSTRVSIRLTTLSNGTMPHRLPPALIVPDHAQLWLSMPRSAADRLLHSPVEAQQPLDVKRRSESRANFIEVVPMFSLAEPAQRQRSLSSEQRHPGTGL